MSFLRRIITVIQKRLLITMINTKNEVTRRLREAIHDPPGRRRLREAIHDPPGRRSSSINTMATLHKNVSCLFSSMDMSFHFNILFLQLSQCLTVCRRITRSASWRRVFERRMKAKGLLVRPLSAGYGIRWNADHDRQSRAYEAREVSIYNHVIILYTCQSR